MIITRTDNREALANANKALTSAKKKSRKVIHLTRDNFVECIEINKEVIPRNEWAKHLNKDVFCLRTFKRKES